MKISDIEQVIKMKAGWLATKLNISYDSAEWIIRKLKLCLDVIKEKNENKN